MSLSVAKYHINKKPPIRVLMMTFSPKSVSAIVKTKIAKPIKNRQNLPLEIMKYKISKKPKTANIRKSRLLVGGEYQTIFTPLSQVILSFFFKQRIKNAR